MNADELYLRKFEDNDMDLFRHWLYKDYILKWYVDTDEWINEVKQKNGEFKFINHFIVMFGDEAIGFCQYYDCYCAQEDWYSVQESNTIFSIDYLIGEEKYLNKGYGKDIIFLLTDEIKKIKDAKQIIVQPEKENTPSNKVLLSAGYTYDIEKGYYILNIK